MTPGHSGSTSATAPSGAAAVRDGKRLFDESGSALPLALISSAALSNGALHIVYGPVETAPDGTYRDAAKAMAEASNHS